MCVCFTNATSRNVSSSSRPLKGYHRRAISGTLYTACADEALGCQSYGAVHERIDANSKYSGVYLGSWLRNDWR